MTADRRAGGRDFAALLRQRRRAAALTQAELASLAGLAVRTVREAEHGRTTRPQRTTAVLLADALGLTGEDRAGFLGAARGEGRQVPRPRAATATYRAHAPPPSLVGRAGEVAQLAELLAAPAGPSPVTLVGLAGVGKTALALAVTQQVAARFAAGVAVVTCDHDLAPDELLDVIAEGLGAAGFHDLPGRVAGSSALLVMDAVDRAVGGPLRKALAQLPPGVQVLATGRLPLAVPGERVWPVTPLPLPPAGSGRDLAEVAAFPAVELFLARLSRVRPDPLAEDEIPALVGLVRRLGGLPLALELAAAHGRLLRLPQILQRYGDRMLDLGEAGDVAGDGDSEGANGGDSEGPNGGDSGGDSVGEPTLRAALAGSYRLLGPAEQAALRRLAVFRARWSVELAEQMLAAAGGRDPVPLLDRLVSLGLIEVQGVRENRFRMLDLVRDFALEQARQRGELASARRAHARVITDLAGRLEPALAGPWLRATATRLDDLAAEVWAALTYAANHDPATALTLAARLTRWWRFRGREVVGHRWLRRLLDDPRTAEAGPTVRAWAMVGLARLAHEHGEGPAELPAARKALIEFRRLGDVSGELVAGRVLAAVCRASGRYDEARDHWAAALAVAVRYRRDRDAAMAQLGLAGQELRVGDLVAARRRLAAADRLGAQSGDRRLRLLATAALAEVARLAGRYEEAVATSRRVLAGLAELGDPGQRRCALGILAQSLAALGRCGEAERVLARLRADPQPAGGAEAACAAVEARLALARGDRVVAAEWFTAAAAALRAGGDFRALLETLVELSACLADPQRREQVLRELAGLCQESGFVLLERERAQLGDDWRPDRLS
jgi:predicted ATPase/DNA-binding XRE family transcriptional regulator